MPSVSVLVWTDISIWSADSLNEKYILSCHKCLLFSHLFVLATSPPCFASTAHRGWQAHMWEHPQVSDSQWEWMGSPIFWYLCIGQAGWQEVGGGSKLITISKGLKQMTPSGDERGDGKFSDSLSYHHSFRVSPRALLQHANSYTSLKQKASSPSQNAISKGHGHALFHRCIWMQHTYLECSVNNNHSTDRIVLDFIRKRWRGSQSCVIMPKNFWPCETDVVTLLFEFLNVIPGIP